MRVSFHPHANHDVMCLSVRWLFLVCLYLLFLSLFYLASFTDFLFSVRHTPSSMSSPPRVKTTALTQNEEYFTVAIYNPLTGYEPKLLDEFDHSETSSMIFQDESGDIDAEPSYSCDAELVGEIVGKGYLHHSSFRSEKNQRTGDKLITLMKKFGASSVLFRTHKNGRDPCTNLVRAAPHKLPTQKKFHGMIDHLDNVGFISSNILLVRKLCCTSLKTTKQ